jgi:hypothetical protein
MHVLSFFIDHINSQFFCKTLRTHMDYGDIHVQIFVGIFLN